MKKIFYVTIFVASMIQLSQAQEQNKFRLGLDIGFAIPDGGSGILAAIEPKYNVANNMNIGLRIESAAMAKNISDGIILIESEIATNISFTATFDYYFNTGSSSFAPFIGLGAGYSSLASIGFYTERFTAENKQDVEGKFGGLLRAGLELGKFRVAANYNLIGKTELEGGGEVSNSYLGISLGFYVGGGKWKK